MNELPVGTVIEGDCLEVMAEWPAKVSLVVTSPPFNAGKEYEPVGTWPSLQAYRDWLIARMNALWHCCEPGAWVVCELMDMHVSPEHSHALPGQIVLDPFAGSGTTCLAAKLEGRQFIGIEQEPKYVKLARARLSAESGRLF